MENSLNAGGGAKFEEVKTMFNAKVSYASCLGLSLVISAQLLKYVFEAKVAEKSIKNLFWHSRSSKVIELSRANVRLPVSD